MASLDAGAARAGTAAESTATGGNRTGTAAEKVDAGANRTGKKAERAVAGVVDAARGQSVGTRVARVSSGGKKRAPARKKPAARATVPKPATRVVAGGGAAKAQADVVRKLLKRVEQKLSGDDVKASLGDYIRLVQLHKELDEETPREIKVTWVEAEGTEKKAGADKESESGT